MSWGLRLMIRGTCGTHYLALYDDFTAHAGGQFVQQTTDHFRARGRRRCGSGSIQCRVNAPKKLAQTNPCASFCPKNNCNYLILMTIYRPLKMGLRFSMKAV